MFEVLQFYQMQYVVLPIFSCDTRVASGIGDTFCDKEVKSLPRAPTLIDVLCNGYCSCTWFYLDVFFCVSASGKKHSSVLLSSGFISLTGKRQFIFSENVEFSQLKLRPDPKKNYQQSGSSPTCSSSSVQRLDLLHANTFLILNWVCLIIEDIFSALILQPRLYFVSSTPLYR